MRRDRWVLRQRVNELDKALQGAGGATGQRFFFQEPDDGLPQRQLAIARRLAHHVQRAVADAAGRRIDHALEGRVVVAGWREGAGKSSDS